MVGGSRRRSVLNESIAMVDLLNGDVEETETAAAAAAAANAMAMAGSHQLGLEGSVTDDNDSYDADDENVAYESVTILAYVVAKCDEAAHRRGPQPPLAAPATPGGRSPKGSLLGMFMSSNGMGSGDSAMDASFAGDDGVARRRTSLLSRRRRRRQSEPPPSHGASAGTDSTSHSSSSSIASALSTTSSGGALLEMLSTTISMIEMMLRRSIVSPAQLYEASGSSLLLLLLRVVDLCCLYAPPQTQPYEVNLAPPSDDFNSSGRTLNTNSTSSSQRNLLRTREAQSAAIEKTCRIFRHLAQVPLARESMSSLPGLLTGLQAVVEAEVSLTSCYNALWVVAQLATEPAAKDILATAHPEIVTCLMEISAPRPAPASPSSQPVPDKADRSLLEACRIQAMRALMNLATYEKMQTVLLSQDAEFLDVILRLLRAKREESVALRTYAAATLRNFAMEEENVNPIMSHKNGSAVDALVCALWSDDDHDHHHHHHHYDDDDDHSIDHLVCEKPGHEHPNQETITMMRYCLEALRLLASEECAKTMGSCPRLFETLADIAVRGVEDEADHHDMGGPAGGAGDNNCSIIACSTLKKLSSFINAKNDNDDAHDRLLRSLIRVVLSADARVLQVQMRMADALASQSNNPDNRASMMNYEDLFRALAKLSSVRATNGSAVAHFQWAVSATLRSLALVLHNRSLMACDAVAETLTNLITNTDIHSSVHTEALSLIHRLSSTASVGHIFGRHEGLMLALTRESLVSPSASPVDVSGAPSLPPTTPTPMNHRRRSTSRESLTEMGMGSRRRSNSRDSVDMGGGGGGGGGGSRRRASSRDSLDMSTRRRTSSRDSLEGPRMRSSSLGESCLLVQEAITAKDLVILLLSLLDD